MILGRLGLILQILFFALVHDAFASDLDGRNSRKRIKTAHNQRRDPFYIDHEGKVTEVGEEAKDGSLSFEAFDEMFKGFLGESPLFSLCHSLRSKKSFFTKKDLRDITVNHRLLESATPSFEIISLNRTYRLIREAMALAVSNGRLDILQEAQRMKLNFNAYLYDSSSGIYFSLLHLASSKKASLQVIELLLQAGADPNLTDSQGLSAFWVAVNNGLEDVVEMMLNYGANLNIYDGSPENQLLLKAVFSQSPRLFSILLNHPRTDLSTRLKVSENRFAHVVELLSYAHYAIEKFKVVFSSSKKFTLTYVEIVNIAESAKGLSDVGFLNDLVKFLMLNSLIDYMENLGFFYLKYFNQAMLEALQNNGLDLKNCQRTNPVPYNLMTLAATLGNAEALKFLTDQGLSPLKDQNSLWPLNLAMQIRSETAFTFLVQNPLVVGAEELKALVLHVITRNQLPELRFIFTSIGHEAAQDLLSALRVSILPIISGNDYEEVRKYIGSNYHFHP